LLINYNLAELYVKQTTEDRKAVLRRAQSSYNDYLRLLDSYDILSPGDSRLFEQYRDAPDTFSTASITDAAARRERKISRFREEKELKQKLEYLQRNPTALQNDDDMYRRLQLARIAYATHQTFQSLESIAQELHILSMAPPSVPSGQSRQAVDERERGGRADGFSERLDGPGSHLSAGMTGPILSADGRPLRPFTLLDNRQRLQQGVFRPDHSLPTMTIDEYLEEERRRGGMIEGGGAQSGMRPEPDEDDIDKADEETMKARAWDEYTENNPKGSGNTLNRG
jgi:immunoglobulin-binding protein 1